MLESDLISELKLRTAIAAIVADRVHDTIALQSPVYPLIIVQRISTASERGMDGPGLAHPRVQISCYADTNLAAKQLARLVRIELDGFAGMLAGGTEVEECWRIDERSLYEDAVEKFVTQQDYEIWHREI